MATIHFKGDLTEPATGKLFLTKDNRVISYYGVEHGEDIKRINTKPDSKIQTLNDFFKILLSAWSKDTAYPTCQEDPTYDEEKNPSYGQCAITAKLACELFGGTIHKVRMKDGTSHYFNKINGKYFDLTCDQFVQQLIEVKYEPNEEVPKDYLGKNGNTKKRYELLAQRISELDRSGDASSP